MSTISSISGLTSAPDRHETMTTRRNEQWPRRAGWVATGLVAGITVGLFGWSAHQQRSRRSLFSASPMDRLAALGYLRAHPSVDSARLLRDYLRWEPHPLLRRHARRVLRRTERLLRS